MKGKRLFNVLILCCCLLILGGSFLPYISVNFPNTNAGWAARSMFQQQLPEMFDEAGNFEATAVDLIADMQTENKLGIIKWWFILTLFLNLVCVLSLLMEKKVKYAIILILDLAQIGLWFAGVFLALPWGMVYYSGISVTTYTGPNLFGIIRNQEMAELIKVFLRGMQVGYWMPCVVAVVSFILCIVALAWKPKEVPDGERVPGQDEDDFRRDETPGDWEEETAGTMEGDPRRWGFAPEEDRRRRVPPPGITCVDGPYAGSHAQMEYEEEVVVGSDEDACTLVIISGRVSPIHMRVRFNEERNEYAVMSVSVDGTFINGYRMDENRWLPLQRGACLKLGRDANILRLD